MGTTARRRTILWGIIAVVGIGGIVSVVTWLNRRHQQNVAAFQASAQLMGLTQIKGQAPGISLIDQNGKHVSLADFRGKIVVLEFMDPVCTDICPIVSAELVQADKLLGARSKQVVFVSVNVNQYHESVTDVKKFSDQHGLSNLDNWYFLTGGTNELQKIWKAYDIYVKPNPTGDVVHSSVMYFIDKTGQEQALADPTNNASQINQWASGIARVVEQLA
jgi:cytochrome oxidase Cu insertion factor (SCO1/SenC/PrrC family)